MRKDCWPVRPEQNVLAHEWNAKACLKRFCTSKSRLEQRIWADMVSLLSVSAGRVFLDVLPQLVIQPGLDRAKTKP